MSTENRSLLGEVTEHFNSNGWNPDGLSSYRMEFVPGGDQSNGNGQGSQQGQGGQLQTDPNSPAGNQNPFLSEIAPEHQQIVAPYLQKWDANVTKKFQDLHSQFAPYQELGDIDTLKQAIGIMQALSQDPQSFIQAVQEALGEEIGEQGIDGNQNGLENQEYANIPPEFIQQFEQQGKIVEALAEFVLGNHEALQEQQEDQELDELLTSLKEQHGEFDEEFVLLKMYQGMSEEDAIKAWQGLMQGQAAQAQQQFQRVPPVINGGGQVPEGEQRKLGSLPRKDIQNFVANVLKDSAAASQ